MGYSAGYFSFNTEGGRCEECKGEGTVTVEMQFMADLVLECESCHGKRFKSDTLEVRYEGKNIYDILEMTVNQAIEFFDEHKQKKIVKKTAAATRSWTRIHQTGTIILYSFGRRKPACQTGIFPEYRKISANYFCIRRTDNRITFPRHKETARGIQLLNSTRTYGCHNRT